MIWKLLDPILSRLARRMEHLAVHHPSLYGEEVARSRGNFSSLAKVASRAEVQSFAPRENLEVADYANVEGSIYLLAPAARCRIGHHSFLGPESRLWILESVIIGDFVQIAPRVDIFDNASHSLDFERRRQDAKNVFEKSVPIDYVHVERAPVVIEDDVWIGTKSTILKGVRIGRGAVIGAASVVTADVEPFTLVAGNPARELRKLS